MSAEPVFANVTRTDQAILRAWEDAIRATLQGEHEATSFS
jgi:hypothetical protein